MELTDEQYRQIEDLLSCQRGNVSLSNLQVLNAILYFTEYGCKWRGLPKPLGNWHTVYTRMNRWAKSGVLDRSLIPVVLPKRNRVSPWQYDREMYRKRNEVERLSRRRKRFRRVSSRFDKREVVFVFFITLALVFDALIRVNRP